VNVSCQDKKADLDLQVARLLAWTAQADLPVVWVEAAVESGMNGTRARAGLLLADPAADVVVVEHCDRLGQMNTELAGAALAAYSRCLVVVDDSKVARGLARDMTDALKGIECALRDTAPHAVPAAGSAACGDAG
jgi:predicted site-specific integrase-resolvase